jgi:hypothetical protein
MSNPLAKVLDQVGLYSPLKRLQRYLLDPQARLKGAELRKDLTQTRKAVGAWAGKGVEAADPNRLFAIISFTNLPMYAKFQCLVAKAVQLRGFTPVVFTHSSCRYGHEYFRLFGCGRLVMWDEWSKKHGPSEEEVLQTVRSLLPDQLTLAAIRDIMLRGVQVGKHALSMACRRRIEGNLDLANPDTQKLFRQEFIMAVQSVLTAERFFDKHPVEKMLVRDSGYTPNGAIYEVGLNRGVDCVVMEFGQRRSTWVLKRYTAKTIAQHYFSLSPSTWEKLKKTAWTAELDAKLEKEFAGRYRPDSTDDTRRLQSGKKTKTPGEVRAQLGLDPKKKTAVIFSHVAWDAAFFYGTGLFDDFEDWLFQTVKYVAGNCPHLNWIVKVHPFNVFKLQRETVKETSEMRLLAPLMPLPDHVRIMQADTDINTQSLFPLVDYILTVNGTVGMEFPCFGIPAVVAGTGRYDGFGFTLEPPTREDYFKTLRQLQLVPRLSDDQRQLARKHYYHLMVRRQTSFEDSLPMELKRLHEAQSDVTNNVQFTARSLEEFKSSHSVKLLGDWLAFSGDHDLLF